MRHVEARLVEPRDLEAVRDHLALDARANLLLIELVARLGRAPAPGELRSQVAVATRAGAICGVVAATAVQRIAACAARGNAKMITAPKSGKNVIQGSKVLSIFVLLPAQPAAQNVLRPIPTRHRATTS